MKDNIEIYLGRKCEKKSSPATGVRTINDGSRGSSPNERLLATPRPPQLRARLYMSGCELAPCLGTLHKRCSSARFFLTLGSASLEFPASDPVGGQCYPPPKVISAVLDLRDNMSPPYKCDFFNDQCFHLCCSII